jgi:pimeloyl-ACP methyl ester carboxylesterase
MRYLRLRAASPRELPAVVFVHGLLGYSFSWRHNLEYFAQHRDVYAVDLLGIGHSDRPEAGTADFGLPATASRLLNFMRSLGHGQIDLVGTSHGGAVAMLAASQDRSSSTPLVRRLALIAPAHPYMNSARLRLAFFGTDFGAMLVRKVASHSEALRSHALSQLYSDKSHITPQTREGYAVNLEDLRSYGYTMEVVRSWREDMKQLEAALPSIASIPAFLLWGADDQAVPASSGLRLRECFRDAEYVVLPGVGHLPYEEAPAEFNRRLLRFLDR